MLDVSNTEFQSKVRSNMKDGSTVQFGTGGEMYPNYQVNNIDGSVEIFRGINHSPFLNAPAGYFNESNLTNNKYTEEDIDSFASSGRSRNFKKA